MKAKTEKQEEIVQAIKSVDNQMKQASTKKEFKQLEKELAGLLEQMLLQVTSPTVRS
jgi:hypothetical protein